MTDSTNPDREEEYHFSELGGAEETNSNGNIYGASSGLGQDASFFSRLRKKNILILIVVLVILVFGYKLIGVFSSAHHQNHKSPVVVTTPKIVKKTAPVVSNKALQHHVSLANAAQTQQLMQHINTLAKDVSAVQNQLNSVSYSLQQLSGSMAKQQQLLVAQDKARRARLAAAKARAKKAKKLAKAKKPLPVYYLKAVIPGRAWLIGPNGETTTVSVGTHIDSYGWVRRIDADSGEIITSSGRVITTSLSDNG